MQQTTILEKINTPEGVSNTQEKTKLSISNSEKTLTVQEALVLLQSTWQKGPYSEFEDLVMKTCNCSREEAEYAREKWLDEGLLAYDPEGLLVWVR